MLTPLFFSTDSLWLDCIKIRTMKKAILRRPGTQKPRLLLKDLESLSCWNKSQVENHTVWCSRVTFGEPRERACDLLGPRPRKYFSDPKWCGRITLMYRAKLGEGPGWVYGPLYTLHTFTISTVSKRNHRTGTQGFCERTSQRPVDQNISCTLTFPKCCWEFIKVAKHFHIITGRLFE